MLNGLKVFDAVDVLAADIAAVIKQHRDEFESEDELRSWLDQDHVEYDERTLPLALGQLEFAAHLKRPRQDHWRNDMPLPGYWGGPKIFTE